MITERGRHVPNRNSSPRPRLYVRVAMATSLLATFDGPMEYQDSAFIPRAHTQECFEVPRSRRSPQSASTNQSWFDISIQGIEGKLPIVSYYNRAPLPNQNRPGLSYKGCTLSTCSNRGYCNAGRCSCFFGFSVLAPCTSTSRVLYPAYPEMFHPQG